MTALKLCSLILFISLLVVLTVNADYPMCTDIKLITENCTFFTPTMDCTKYNFTIYNFTHQVRNGSLTQIASSNLYKFNLTDDSGDYLLVLCDGSTREMRVRQNSTYSLALSVFEDASVVSMMGILFILVFVCGMFAYLSINLGDQHSAMKLFFFFSIFVLLVLSLNVSRSTIVSYAPTSVIDLVNVAHHFLVVILVLVFLYFILMWITKFFTEFAKQRYKQKGII